MRLNLKDLSKNEEFLEYAKVFNNLYGTTRTPVIDKLNKGKNVFLILIGKVRIKLRIKN